MEEKEALFLARQAARRVDLDPDEEHLLRLCQEMAKVLVLEVGWAGRRTKQLRELHRLADNYVRAQERVAVKEVRQRFMEKQTTIKDLVLCIDAIETLDQLDTH